MKRHQAVMARDAGTSKLIPLKMRVLFQTGDIDGAIAQGASELGWPLTGGYDFVSVERFMGLYHEVSAKENALSCAECHVAGNRIDFATLGYPPLNSNRSTCATGCHEASKASNWVAGDFQDFTAYHQKHVRGEGINCSRCHAFSSAY
jgi:hypothetical protein